MRPKLREVSEMEIDVRNEVIPKLKNVKKNKNGYQACCPAHDDETPSLSIKDTNDKLVLYCHRGCEYKDILRALGIYNPEKKKENLEAKNRNQQKKIVKTYDYTDENGKLLYQIVRYEPKSFSLRRPDGNGGWIWNSEGIKKTLYCLPDVKEAKEKGKMVVFCEGEKDAESVKAKLNLMTTTSPLGANSWNDIYADSLSGLNVVILPDNDEAGQNYAQTIAHSIYGKASSIKIVNLPNLAEKEDVSDWIEKGGSQQEILEIIDKTDEWNPENTALIKIGDALSETVLDGIYDDYLLTARFTDTGNAECFYLEHKGNFLFNKTLEQWYQWNGVIWKNDEKNVVDYEILKMIRARQNAVLGTSDTEKLKQANYLIRCEDINKRKNIKEAIELIPQFITVIDEYDKDLFLVATQNGTLDLRECKFRESNQEDYLTLQIGTEYNPDADCPRWKQFLKEIFSNDDEIIDFVQKIVGYSLTGDISEQVMFILYGFGKNGKSVFLNTVGALLGDYSGTATFKTFDADKQSEQSNDLAMLKGKRFVSMSESAADRKLNEPLIKQVTGGDEITCRFLRREFFSFVPQFKLFLATNHKPVIMQSDFGIWRRIVLIPFEQNFDGREESGLQEHLISELPGILNWAIEGLKKWHTEGLRKQPQAVVQATNRYRLDSDTVQQWLDSNMARHRDSEIQSSEAYNDYRAWANENGNYPVGNKTFKSALEEKGFYLKKKSKANYWQGFGFPFNLK